ncbi:hypothetical protein L210DRAFT_905867 [Boletus edulis BED1]|uniref:Uncharacterized protein n=1 Tax=Boletus edulis BED1 TaxID=1328754 RepID=A0AAD4C1Z2_BOLED|nr:hypothetical protein L210DRAFT_905867 [Boletus edulis BED1]
MLPAYNFYPNNDLLDPSYPYLEHTYLPLHFRDPVRLPTPVPDADLSFTPISQQLIYPTARRVVGPAELDYYNATSQHLFPTPSELLSNISHRRQSCPRDISEPRPYVQPSPPPPQTSRQQSPDADTSAAPLNTSVTKTESQRKARQRAIAEEIGFTPTDPDTISSHEKKRHYLECLEQYVLYLHDQLRLVQTEPLALERVSTYRGLSSRSIRTLLVHMQNTNKTLHEGTLVEEQVFLDLSAQVMTAHNAGLPLRRHSVDIAGMSRHTGYNPNLTPFDQTSSFPLDDMTASGSPSSADGSSASPDTSTDLATQRFLFPSAGDGM